MAAGSSATHRNQFLGRSWLVSDDRDNPDPPLGGRCLSASFEHSVDVWQQPECGQEREVFPYPTNASEKESMAKKKVREPKKVMLFLRMLLNVVLAITFFGLALFLPAGSFNYWNAWLFLGIFVIEFAAILTYFALTNPTYAEKRLQASEGEIAQRVVMVLLVLCALGMMLLAGFNYRYLWSFVPLWLVIVGAVLMSVGLLGVFLVMKQNSYASRVVEIQTDQKLIDSGMYSVVRHPMYSAFALMFCISPLVLGSYWSLIPAFCIAFLLTFRIRNEEEVLIKGLKGYKRYVKKVRYRLISFVW